MTKKRVPSVEPNRDVMCQTSKAKSGSAGANSARDDEFVVLAELIRARQQARLTQHDVAARMGIAPSALSRIEGSVTSRKHVPTLAMLRAYSSVVGVGLKFKLVGSGSGSSDAASVSSVEHLAASIERPDECNELSPPSGCLTGQLVPASYPESPLSRAWSHDARSKPFIEEMHELGWSEEDIRQLAMHVRLEFELATAEKDDALNGTPPSRLATFKGNLARRCEQFQSEIDDLGDRWRALADGLLKSTDNEINFAGQLLLLIKGLPPDVGPNDFLQPKPAGQPLLALRDAIRRSPLRKSVIRRDSAFVQRRLIRFLAPILERETKHWANMVAGLVAVAVGATKDIDPRDVQDLMRAQ